MRNERLIDLRNKKNISIRRLAIEINTNYDTLQKLERDNRYNCKIDVLLKLSKYFDVSIDYLVYNEKDLVLKRI